MVAGAEVARRASEPDGLVDEAQELADADSERTRGATDRVADAVGRVAQIMLPTSGCSWVMVA